MLRFAPDSTLARLLNQSIDRLTLINRLRRVGFRFELISRHLVIADNGKVRIRCRVGTSNDLGHLWEIFCLGVYGYDFEGEVVADIGASNGDSSIYFASRGARRVIALEPTDESFLLAEANVSGNGLHDRVVLMKAALGARRGREMFRTSARFPNMNALESSDFSMGLDSDHSAREVRVMDLDQLFDEQNLSRIDLLKLDCEGAEYEILRGLSPSNAKRIKRIVAEYHNGAQDLPKLLFRAGYCVRWSTHAPETTEARSAADRRGLIAAEQISNLHVPKE